MAAAGVLNLIVKKVSSGTFTEKQLSQMATTTLKAGSRISLFMHCFGVLALPITCCSQSSCVGVDFFTRMPRGISVLEALEEMQLTSVLHGTLVEETKALVME